MIYAILFFSAQLQNNIQAPVEKRKIQISYTILSLLIWSLLSVDFDLY